MKYIIDEKNNILLKINENIELKENERIIEDIDYEYPIFDAETQKVREANREEKIIVYKHDVLLEDGEIVENRKITKIKKPSDNAIWRKEYFGKGYWEKIPTREEICGSGDLSVLADGEKFQDGHIIQVPNPSTKYLRYNWNRNAFEWELSTTKEELQQTRKNLILDYSKKKEEIAILESVKEFNTVDDVKTSKEELAKKKKEIDELTEIIKEMNKNEGSISNRA